MSCSLRRAVLLVACSVLIPSVALAKDAKKKKGSSDQVVGETDEGKAIVRRDDSVLEDSSEHHRQGKQWSVVGEMGFGVGAIPTSGIAAGYYHKSNTLLEASYVSGDIDIIFINVAAKLAEFRVKQFWGNSFYTNLGLGYRTIELGATLEPLTGTKDVDSFLSVSSIGASIGIGNRWQWDMFTIGCDWIGYFVPLSTTGDTKVKEAGADPADVKRTEEEAEDLGKASSSQLLRFYLGVSF